MAARGLPSEGSDDDYDDDVREYERTEDEDEDEDEDELEGGGAAAAVESANLKSATNCGGSKAGNAPGSSSAVCTPALLQFSTF